MPIVDRHWLAFALALVIDAGPCAGATPARPNVVLIMSDDMGFSDLGCYGGEIRTPHLDRLAAGGLRFTQFYNNARCCPTRASLLTGLYPHQAGIGHMMEDRGNDAYRGDLSRRSVTIAEALRPAGYRPYMVGKWHVTRFLRPDAPRHNWPLQRGFERYYGTIEGAGSYFDPATLTRDNTPISPFADPSYRPETYYYTDALSDHAASFVADHARDHKGKPFFLYVAYTAAHWPMHALPEDIAAYRGKYDSGYGAVRKARFAKMTGLGLIDGAQGLSKGAGDWASVEDRAWEAAGMEVYAAMIDRMDRGIGKLVGTLERTGQLDDTLILFLQDNGGCAEVMGREEDEGHPDIPRPAAPTLPPMKPDALLPIGVVPPQTRDGYPVRMGRNATPGPGDTYVAYGRGWANVSNTPFREYKHWVHEGGISTPLVAHWPSGIPAGRGGALVKDPAHLVDLMATCLDLAGATYPAEVGGAAIPGPEGVSLRPALEGRPLGRPRPIFWEHEGNRAVRDGRWKLVAKYDRPWELYDIDRDRTEQDDLASTMPDRVKDLSARWDAWAARVGVRPWTPPARRSARPAADR